MTNNKIKSILRRLWRNRLFTGLNVLGLAISISACWTIYRIVDHEFSYDAQLPDKENIYQVVSSFSSDNKRAGASAPLYQGIRDEIPGVEETEVATGGREGSWKSDVPTSLCLILTDKYRWSNDRDIFKWM